MIQRETRLKVADNSAKEVMCIGYYGPQGRVLKRVLGKKIKVTVKKTLPGAMKKGTTVEAVVVRSRRPQGRPDGSYVAYGDNAVFLLDPKKDAAKKNNIVGPVPRELRKVNLPIAVKTSEMD